MDQALPKSFSLSSINPLGQQGKNRSGGALQGKDKRQFLLLQILRVLAIFPIVYFVAGLLKLGTPPLALSIAASLGVLSAGRLVSRQRSLKQSLIYHGSILLSKFSPLTASTTVRNLLSGGLRLYSSFLDN